MRPPELLHALTLAASVRKDLRDFGQEAKIALRAHVMGRIAEQIDPLLNKQFELAMAGDSRILISLLDRAIDRPTEHHEITAHTVPLFALPAGDDVSAANPLLDAKEDPTEPDELYAGQTPESAGLARDG